MIKMDNFQYDALHQFFTCLYFMAVTRDGVMVMCSGNALQCITIFKVMGSNV